MQIDTSFHWPQTSATSAWTAGATGASLTTRRAVSGPPAQVSLGESTPTFTGFTDYLKLGLSGVWQFNLTGVLSPPDSGVPHTARSPDQQKADQAAVDQAFELINQGQYEQARGLMEKLLSEDKTNSAAVHAIGYAHLSEGNYQAAERMFLKAHALNPTVGYDNDARNARVLQLDDQTVLARARAMVNAPEQRSEGIRILIALTQRSPDDAGAHLLLGDTLLKAGDQADGLLQYSSAIRSANSGQLEQIETRLTDLARSAPKSAFLQQLLGKIRVRQGRFEQAVQTLTRANELADNGYGYRRDLAEAQVGLGRELLKSGDLNAAMAAFQRARDLDPTGRETKAAVAEGCLARAEQNARRRDYQSAVQDYRMAADLLGKNGDQALRERAAHGVFAVGRTLERRRIEAGEEIDGEVLAFQVAYDLSPDNNTYKRKLADTRNALGDQLYADGGYEQAAQAYLRAHQLFQYDATYKANTITAFVAYGDQRLASLNYTDAVEAYREAYKVDTGRMGTKQKLADAYNARGLDYMSLEKYTLAVADFKEALRLFPDNAEYQANYNSVSPWDT
jgi:tetratricopeptide (TPR) repeat protein